MATIALSSDLDVLSRYEALTSASLGSESVYARLKDTVNKLVKDGDLSDTEKGKVVAEVLGGLSSSISNSSMQIALQWATAEKELYLKKLELGKQLDILDNQINESEAAADKMYHESIATQANTIRMLGKPILNGDGKVDSLENEGKLWQDIKIGEVQETNLGKESLLLDSKLNESYAAIHKTVADTVVNFGPWKYQLSEEGITTQPTRTDMGSSFSPLSDIQRIIAEEQAKGYTYNAWSNAVTASAGMIGTIVASDGDPDSVPAIMNPFKEALSQLKGVSIPSKLTAVTPTTP